MGAAAVKNSRWVVQSAIVMVIVAAFAVGRADASTVDSAVEAWFRGLSLPLPGGASVVVCHGFNCHFRTHVGLTASDRRTLAAMVRGATPAAERRGVARAVAWFDKRVGRLTGTTGAKAFASGLAGDRGQYDCVDRATNTTSLFVILANWNLLRHHRVEHPQSRGFVPIVDGPHSTAVLKESKSGQQWAVDPWTRNFAELPDVMPIEKWHAQSVRPQS